ncbi:MAG TPA: hypothetical protein PKY86_05275 [Niabella sp.]|nr:hypothetical protein [Niabella sp.]HQX73474.1 hypothetical protein [Chitinophagaceae bacterium]HRB72810.1 hypothetical protein [Flavobacterium sp.]HQX21440.1 hypothetical protein [Niabella sp.]HRB36118.1 hypothetical protein [Niabella sp.]
MQTINKHATDIFLNLIGQLGDTSFICFQSANGPPLFLEYYGALQSGFGDGRVCSLMQTKMKGNEAIREPEIFFLVFTDDPANIFQGICPYSYQMDSAGIHERSMVFRPQGHLELNLSLQQRHVQLANDWLVQINQQEFVLLTKKII